MSYRPDAGNLTGGFADPVFDSNSVFRTLLKATAYAGREFHVHPPVAVPSPLNTSTAGLCLSLVDSETPVWLDEKSAEKQPLLTWLRFNCGAPIVQDARSARFAVVLESGHLPRLDSFGCGSTDYPDLSTTLVVQVPSLVDGSLTTWSGPGIRGCTRVGIAGLPDWFWSDWKLNTELYPMGVDVFFTNGNAVVSLPRTIRVES